MAKLKFEVWFDTDRGDWWVDPASDNFKFEHSGSSYFRIITDEFYGTVGGHCPGPDGACPGADPTKKSSWCEGKYKHLSFSIQKTSLQ